MGVGILHPNVIGHGMGQKGQSVGHIIGLSTNMRKGALLKVDPVGSNTPDVVTKVRSRVGGGFIHTIRH
jgi:predicted nucleic acid-binding Zn finger protein